MTTKNLITGITLAVVVGLGLRLAAQVADRRAPAGPGRQARRRRTHQGPRSRAGGQSGGQRRRSRRPRVPAPELRQGEVAALPGGLRPARLLHRRRTVGPGNSRTADHRGRLCPRREEIIVVLPDSKTVHNGSMYSSSVTTGDFERFIAHDLVAYIDAHYRTIPNRTSRGLVGHSMGGYGATRIGMKHADVFGSLYIMSPCCLSPRGAGPANPELEKTLQSVKTPADSAGLAVLRPRPAGHRGGLVAQPEEPAALPRPADRRTVPLSRTCSRGGRRTRRWPSSISTSATSGGTGPSRSTWATRTVCGSMPGSCTTSSTSTASRTRFEIYPGTHTSKVADRFQNHVMTFFSGSLSFEAGRR